MANIAISTTATITTSSVNCTSATFETLSKRPSRVAVALRSSSSKRCNHVVDRSSIPKDTCSRRSSKLNRVTGGENASASFDAGTCNRKGFYVWPTKFRAALGDRAPTSGAFNPTKKVKDYTASCRQSPFRSIQTSCRTLSPWANRWATDSRCQR